jgi:hypothetical protein
MNFVENHINYIVITNFIVEILNKKLSNDNLRKQVWMKFKKLYIII